MTEDSWDKQEKHVLSELGRLDHDVRRLITTIETHNIYNLKAFAELKADVKVLKFQALAIGTLVSVVVTALVNFVFKKI